MKQIEINNHQMVNLIAEIEAFNEEAKDEKVPASISYGINRTYVNLQKKHKPFEDARQDMLNRHSKKGEDGKTPVLEEKTDKSGEKFMEIVMMDQEAFEKEANDLLAEKIKVEVYQFVDVENKIQGWSAKQSVMERLWFLIDIINHYGNNN